MSSQWTINTPKHVDGFGPLDDCYVNSQTTFERRTGLWWSDLKHWLTHNRMICHLFDHDYVQYSNVLKPTSCARCGNHLRIRKAIY